MKPALRRWGERDALAARVLRGARALRSHWDRVRFRRDLVRLHDVLARSALHEHYFVWGGMLLGWAREGRLLPHDSDADFAFYREDQPRLLAALPRLETAGFRLDHTFRNNAGRVTEYVLRRGAGKFDFFEVVRERASFRYWVYFARDALELEGVAPCARLGPMRFLGRTWLKPEDHETHLRAVYGDWEVPHPQYFYVTDERSIVARRPWAHTIGWVSPPGSET
jgi:hypothetical protein